MNNDYNYVIGFKQIMMNKSMPLGFIHRRENSAKKKKGSVIIITLIERSQ